VPNNDYSAKHIFQMDACTNCQLCADVCPAVQAAGKGELSGAHRLRALKKIMKGRMGGFWRLFGNKAPSDEELKAFSETVFRCTLCGHCQVACPVGIELRDIWLSLRQDLNRSSAQPKKVDMIRENLESSHNVFDEDNEERAEWTEEMDEEPEDQLGQGVGQGGLFHRLRGLLLPHGPADPGGPGRNPAGG
jgi:heterodisulfide reductase subunit D